MLYILYQLLVMGWESFYHADNSVIIHVRAISSDYYLAANHDEALPAAIRSKVGTTRTTGLADIVHQPTHTPRLSQSSQGAATTCVPMWLFISVCAVTGLLLVIGICVFVAIGIRRRRRRSRTKCVEPAHQTGTCTCTTLFETYCF